MTPTIISISYFIGREPLRVICCYSTVCLSVAKDLKRAGATMIVIDPECLNGQAWLWAKDGKL